MRIEVAVRCFLAASCVVLSCCAQQGPTTTAFDGVYQGAGQLTDIGLPCDHTMHLEPLKVAGGHAVLGRVFGQVQPDGQLQMTYAGIWFMGQFQGNQFQGTVWNPRSPCRYRVEMTRTS
jgi:hypothetical protein